MFQSVVLFGDTEGIAQLVEVIPIRRIRGIVASSIRPQYISELQVIAESIHVPLFVQPKFSSPEVATFVANIKNMQFDLLVSNSYSMIVREDLLESVNYNAVNIHWSLLPFNRGPNPIQWAIIKGEKKTGISIHYMDLGLDTGDIIAQIEEEIFERDTWLTLRDRLKARATDFIGTTLKSVLAGTNKRQKQPIDAGSTNSRLTAESPAINFNKMTDLQVFNLIRAQVDPLGGAYIDHNGSRTYFKKYLEVEEIKALRSKYAE